MEEVIAFSTRSLTDPRPLINYVFGTFIEEVISRQRSGSWEIEESERLKNEGKRSNQIAILEWLYTESRVPLFGQWNHNRHVNLYIHDEDVKHARSRDTTPLDTPSKLYQFIGIQENVKVTFPDQVEEAPESFISILWPSPKATEPLLGICHKISQHQPLTDLHLLGIQVPDTPRTEAPVMSKNTRSIWISYCDIPTSFLRSILKQLAECSALQLFRLDGMALQELEADLDQLLQSLVSHHEKRDEDQTGLRIAFSHSTLSDAFKKKWMARCEGMKIRLELTCVTYQQHLYLVSIIRHTARDLIISFLPTASKGWGKVMFLVCLHLGGCPIPAKLGTPLAKVGTHWPR